MEDKFRLQLDVTAAVLAQIDALKERTLATSRAETIRYALRTLQWLEKASKSGRVLVEDSDGLRQVVFPFLEQAAPGKVPANSTIEKLVRTRELAKGVLRKQWAKETRGHEAATAAEEAAEK